MLSTRLDRAILALRLQSGRAYFAFFKQRYFRRTVVLQTAAKV